MKKSKILLLMMAAVLITAMFYGCGVKTDTPIIGKIAGLNKNEIFEIDDLICSKAEYMLLFMNTQNQYKENLGDEIDWNAKADKKLLLKDVLNNQVKEEITVYYTLASMAKNNGINLSDEEKAAVSKAAKKYYDALTDEEKKYTDASQADVVNFYTNYYLADKEMKRITKDAGNNISDEEARVIRIQYIHMNTSEMSKKKIKSVLEDVTGYVNGGYQEFSREAKQYSIDESIEAVIKKNEAKKAYEMEAFDLSKGEVSKIVSDGDDYYLIYCVDSYMKKETADNKKKIIEDVKQQVLEQTYNEYLEEMSSDFNTAVWEELEVSESRKVSSTELMKIYNNIK